jgi:hypothetical protein
VIGALTNRRATLVRRVTVNADRTITIEDLPTPPMFYVGVEPPRAARTGEDSARAAPSYTLRWHYGPLGPPDPVPGAASRVMVAELAYELLFSPKQLLAGRQPVGWEAAAQLVDVLYPFTGALQTQAGAALGPVAFDLWSPSESHGATGTYEDYTAHAPVDFSDVLERNQRIVLGAQIYNVLNVNEHTIEPHVTFSLRRSGG